MLHLITEFDISLAAKAGGKTGSMRVPLLSTQGDAPRVYFQLKPSILDNTTARKIKAGGTDRENFGEVIAAAIARPVMPGLVPEVSLVYDPARKRVAIASKYLTGTKIRTLDDYAKEKGVSIKKGKHARFVSGEASEGEYSFDGDPVLKQGLVRALAISMLTGDHDINPGNMLVIQGEAGDERIARIDFGHAFNDLLNASATFGGRVRNTKNQALDFLNRRNVAGLSFSYDSINTGEAKKIKIGSQSKLWRDYPGLIPSQELANALTELSDPKNLALVREGTLRARSDFLELLGKLETENDNEGIVHLKKTLAAIHNNIADSKHKINPKKMSAEQLIKVVFNQIYNFSAANLSQMRKTGDIMKLQANIDKFLKSPNPQENTSAIAKIQEEYDELCKTYNKTKITWVKTHPVAREVNGTLQEYVRKRAKQLGIKQYFTFGLPDKLTTSFTIDGKKYNVDKPLTGRGQPGFAAFCVAENETKQQLIKVDNAGTCLAEGTAKVLPSQLIPKRYQRTANFADVGVKQSSVADAQVVSIQSRVMPSEPGNKIVPLDEVVYGKKRNPKTLISYERLYNQKISQFLKTASEDVKWQFATALYASVAAGDESSHLGQFMAEVNAHGQVVGITRIDFGASGRYAKAREAKDDFDPLHTSKKYARSGQFGKDYINYLLRNESIRSKYISLWQQKLDPEQISRQTESNFLEKLHKLPEAQRILAIQEMVATINKGAKTRDKFTVPGVDLKHILLDDLQEVEAKLAHEIASITRKRMDAMSKKAANLQCSAKDSKELKKMHAHDARVTQRAAAALAPAISEAVAPVAVRQPLLALPLDHGRRATELRQEQADHQPFEFESEAESDSEELSPSSYHIQMTEQGLTTSISPEYKPTGGSESLCLRVFLTTYLGNLPQGGQSPVIRTHPQDDPILAANFYACAQLFMAAGMPIKIKGLERVTSQEAVDQAKQKLAQLFKITGRDADIGHAIIQQELVGPSAQFFTDHIAGNINRNYADRDVSHNFGTLLVAKDLCMQAVGANDLVQSINDYVDQSPSPSHSTRTLHS